MTLSVPISHSSVDKSLDPCRDIATARQCEALLARRHLPEGVVRHSRKVAEIALQIADALAAAGFPIDRDLVRAGGLLHDLAKGQPKHAEAGAAILRSLGMPEVAAIIAGHTEMEFTGAIDERAIVYLADKLTSGDKFVTLDERFRPALFRFCEMPEALEVVHRHKETAERIASAIEARMGMALATILHEGSGLSAQKVGMAIPMEETI